MTALPRTAPISQPTATRTLLLGVLRVLLLAEAAITLGLAIFLSVLAGEAREIVTGDAAAASESTIRFAAAAAFLFAIAAAIAARGARRRRGWSWTLAALLQLVLAIGIGVAVMAAAWHPAFLVGFALAAVVMMVLSATSVRRALGQE